MGRKPRKKPRSKFLPKYSDGRMQIKKVMAKYNQKISKEVEEGEEENFYHAVDCAIFKGEKCNCNPENENNVAKIGE